MYIIKTLPHTFYNVWGNPAIQKLGWHDQWYFTVSTTMCDRNIESMVFLCDKHGKERYDVAVLTQYGKTYEEAEDNALETLKSMSRWSRDGDISIEAWADKELRELYDLGYTGHRIGRFLRIVALSHTAPLR